MSVWVTIPSARPVEEVAKWAAAWKSSGYRIALWRDDGPWTEEWGAIGVEMVLTDEKYPGYAQAINSMIKVLTLGYNDPLHDAEWFIIGGDDVWPDPNHTAEQIAWECGKHFALTTSSSGGSWVPGTFGVMQPTSDRWGENPSHPNPVLQSAYIDRVAGSAWFGREYCTRVNQGRGPLWPEYQHMFVDQEARAVAVKLGVYWERPDLLHHHAHAGRVKNYDVSMIPPHLKKWTTGPEGRAHWQESEALYKRRESDDFPGHEPLLCYDNRIK